MLHYSLQLAATVPRGAPVGKDRIAGLGDTHHFGHDVRRGPWRTAHWFINRIAIDSGIGGYLINLLGITPDNL